MSGRPAPFTPADCDLQDFPFMPLHVARLRDSDLAGEEHPEACWYAVMLWSAAWHQIPAGSLPDNETVLARLCGLGRDLKTFRKHRAGAMRGFVLCDDGRLYHPTVAEQALAAWESKLQQRWRSECARIKKANQRNGTDLPSPTYEEFLSGPSSETGHPCPPSVPRDKAECPQGQSVQETGTGTGISKEEESFALVVAAAPTPPDRLPAGLVQQAFDEWNAMAAGCASPKAISLTDDRRRKLAAKLKDVGIEGWRTALAKVAASPHCQGDNDRGWKADLDFLFQARSWNRLMEGAYDRRAPANQNQRSGSRGGWDPMEQAIAGIDFNEDFAA